MKPIFLPLLAAMTSVSWGLTSLPEAFPLAALCVGPVSGQMTLSHMQATDTRRDALIDGISGATVVRFHNADADGTKADWPTNETGENGERYMDFALTAPDTMEVRVEKIYMRIGAFSTGFMKCRIHAGFGDALTDDRTVYEATRTALPNMSLTNLELTPALTVPAGETLHIRLMPWNEQDNGTGKYLLVRDVEIVGQAFTASETGLDDIPTPLTRPQKVLRDGQLFIIRDDKTYTLQGRMIP